MASNFNVFEKHSSFFEEIMYRTIDDISFETKYVKTRATNVFLHIIFWEFDSDFDVFMAISKHGHNGFLASIYPGSSGRYAKIISEIIKRIEKSEYFTFFQKVCEELEKSKKSDEKFSLDYKTAKDLEKNVKEKRHLEKLEKFNLSEDNYYSQEANELYMSVHQYLDFVGHMGVHGCESRAVAKLKGEWVEETTDAMMVGSYVDSYFEGTLEEFKKDHPEIFTQKGQLYAKYKKAEEMIARCERDEYFMKTMSGEKQVIMTAPLFGCEWKIKIDSYIPGVAIVDLKTSANLHKAWKVADYGYASFVEYWAYTLQMAIYQKVVEINTGKKLPCYLSCVTKEDEPEIAVIYIDQTTLDNALNEIEMNMQSVLMVKNGESDPIRCETCDYCRRTKKLTKAINYQDLIMQGGDY